MFASAFIRSIIAIGFGSSTKTIGLHLRSWVLAILSHTFIAIKTDRPQDVEPDRSEKMTKMITTLFLCLLVHISPQISRAAADVTVGGGSSGGEEADSVQALRDLFLPSSTAGEVSNTPNDGSFNQGGPVKGEANAPDLWVSIWVSSEGPI